MRIIRDLDSCPASARGSVVALGNFDGVHLGHREILSQCVASARAYGVAAAVMTFEPHPREFFSKSHERLRLTGLHRKAQLMETLGIDTIFLVRFNRRFADLSAPQFVGDVLRGALNVRHVVTGYDFAFGKNRSGSTDFLETQAHRHGFGFTACPPVAGAQGEVISSSAIRQRLAEGDTHKASALLGRPYTIEGRVRRGHQRGRTLGFPTANIALTRLFRPRYGVYAIKATVAGEAYDGVANIGVKPTVGGEQPLLEAHLFAMDQNVYGQRMEVTLGGFIRDEKKFDSLDALKTQIAVDATTARELLHASQ